jgi:hypothetical protein
MFARESDCGIIDSSFWLQSASPLIDAGDPAKLDADGSRSDLGWWGGPQGSTYVYIDQPPAPPESLYYSYSYPDVTLWWPSSHETDLAQYDLHRDDHSGFVPSTGNLIASLLPPDTSYVDTLDDSLTGTYYVVVARDAGAQGCASNELAVIPTGVFDPEDPETGVPRSVGILRVYPNPFNASTVINVRVPGAASASFPIRIDVFSVLGNRVSVAYEGPLTRGIHEIPWQARDRSGFLLPSGVYFADMRISGHSVGQVAKMVILR